MELGEIKKKYGVQQSDAADFESVRSKLSMLKDRASKAIYGINRYLSTYNAAAKAAGKSSVTIQDIIRELKKDWGA